MPKLEKSSFYVLGCRSNQTLLDQAWLRALVGVVPRYKTDESMTSSMLAHDGTGHQSTVL